MQNLINGAPVKKNYDFIDAIRCIAMMAIVVEHSIGSYNFTKGTDLYWAYIGFTQFAKFGTIAFFLLAGFLISEKFTDYTPAEYLKRRISTTFGPWIFWSLVYVLAMIINMAVKERIYHRGDFTLINILNAIETVYLYTNYWFIINFLISISILLIFRRYVYSIYMGIILLCFTVFYAVNIHFEWIQTSHTTAILGFVFFLWMGAQLRKHWQQIEKWVSNLSYLAIFVAFVLTFSLSVYETYELSNFSADYLNTLRFSNVLYSLVFFVLLLRIKTFPFTTYLKPRQTTYGIYLIHYILVSFLMPEILGHFSFDVNTMGATAFVLLKIATFLVAYLLTLGIVLLLNRGRARVLVGN
ncbi:acyltransferase [Mucilaginibacter calamicampi]|uniref:Acyltransferase n=1 Tax=Mucilaginibacter calamicampi TaxID=1302352 RepID=A0ABW2Z105_9SPHI